MPPSADRAVAGGPDRETRGSRTLVSVGGGERPGGLPRLPRAGGLARAAWRRLPLAWRAPACPPTGRLAHRSTNVCSNQEGFTARLHMCSNYLRVSGNSWPPAKIRWYLTVPSKRRPVQLPRPAGDGRPPGDAEQPASRQAEPPRPLRSARAGNHVGRPKRRRDGEIPVTKIIADAEHPARARGVGGSRPRRETAVDHRHSPCSSRRSEPFSLRAGLIPAAKTGNA
jgi:hypothetical protein